MAAENEPANDHRPVRMRWARRAELRGVALVASLCLCLSLQAAEGDDERRVRTGAKLFRALLAADLDLGERRADSGELRVLVLGSDVDLLEEAITLIAGEDGSTLGDLPVGVEVIGELSANGDAPVAGVFIADPAPAELAAIIRWGIEHGTIIYSPFEGHVEAGALAGIAVEARVRPYVNQQTLDAAGIRLKPFFLKVAKIHDERGG